jgi:hypothetical protein
MAYRAKDYLHSQPAAVANRSSGEAVKKQLRGAAIACLLAVHMLSPIQAQTSVVRTIDVDLSTLTINAEVQSPGPVTVELGPGQAGNALGPSVTPLWIGSTYALSLDYRAHLCPDYVPAEDDSGPPLPQPCKALLPGDQLQLIQGVNREEVLVPELRAYADANTQRVFGVAPPGSTLNIRLPAVGTQQTIFVGPAGSFEVLGLNGLRAGDTAIVTLRSGNRNFHTRAVAPRIDIVPFAAEITGFAAPNSVVQMSAHKHTGANVNQRYITDGAGRLKTGAVPYGGYGSQAPAWLEAGDWVTITADGQTISATVAAFDAALDPVTQRVSLTATRPARFSLEQESDTSFVASDGQGAFSMTLASRRPITVGLIDAAGNRTQQPLGFPELHIHYDTNFAGDKNELTLGKHTGTKAFQRIQLEAINAYGQVIRSEVSTTDETRSVEVAWYADQTVFVNPSAPNHIERLRLSAGQQVLADWRLPTRVITANVEAGAIYGTVDPAATVAIRLISPWEQHIIVTPSATGHFSATFPPNPDKHIFGFVTVSMPDGLHLRERISTYVPHPTLPVPVCDPMLEHATIGKLEVSMRNTCPDLPASLVLRAANGAVKSQISNITTSTRAAQDWTDSQARILPGDTIDVIVRTASKRYTVPAFGIAFNTDESALRLRGPAGARVQFGYSPVHTITMPASDGIDLDTAWFFENAAVQINAVRASFVDNNGIQWRAYEERVLPVLIPLLERTLEIPQSSTVVTATLRSPAGQLTTARDVSTSSGLQKLDFGRPIAPGDVLILTGGARKAEIKLQPLSLRMSRGLGEFNVSVRAPPNQPLVTRYFVSPNDLFAAAERSVVTTSITGTLHFSASLKALERVDMKLGVLLYTGGRYQYIYAAQGDTSRRLTWGPEQNCIRGNAPNIGAEVTLNIDGVAHRVWNGSKGFELCVASAIRDGAVVTLSEDSESDAQRVIARATLHSIVIYYDTKRQAYIGRAAPHTRLIISVNSDQQHVLQFITDEKGGFVVEGLESLGLASVQGIQGDGARVFAIIDVQAFARRLYLPVAIRNQTFAQ